MTSARKQCRWVGCDAHVHSRQLCQIHYFMWPVERYIHGEEPSNERVGSSGYLEWCVNGFWAPAHRLVLARELGRHLHHDEFVVHLDGERTNPDRDNLWLTDQSSAIKWRKENPRKKNNNPRIFDVTIKLKFEAGRAITEDDEEVLRSGIHEMLAAAELDGSFVTEDGEDVPFRHRYVGISHVGIRPT